MNEESRWKENAREGLSPAESSPRGNSIEVHSGADSVKRVARYGVHTLRVLRESRNALLRVEPRITSSLIRDGVFYFLAESVLSTLF